MNFWKDGIPALRAKFAFHHPFSKEGRSSNETVCQSVPKHSLLEYHPLLALYQEDFSIFRFCADDDLLHWLYEKRI
jgi:hypothetical protein